MTKPSSSPDPRLQQAEQLEKEAAWADPAEEAYRSALLAGASALRSAVSVIEELEKVKAQVAKIPALVSPVATLQARELVTDYIDTRIAALRSTET